MKYMTVDPMALEAIKNYTLPEVQGFGKILSPVMVQGFYNDGEWKDLRLLPYGPLLLDPTAKVLHYGQEIFEGMKAYRVTGDRPLFFRAEQNFTRFNQSAHRLAMPQVPEAYFFEALHTIVYYSAPFIPRQSGQSLYLRPFMFSHEPFLGIQPPSTFCFMVVASPTASYFTHGDLELLIERTATRAAPGGTGWVKAGGNYGTAVASGLKARELGYHQVLWLDALKKTYIEELSGMNFFAVVNGTLVTPALSDTILPGVTRDSLLTLAPELDIPVREAKMEVGQLLKQIQSGECTEAFACGTASIIAPVKCLGEENGEKYYLPYSNGPVTQRLRQTLLDIQEGRRTGPAGWVQPLPDFPDLPYPPRK